MDRNLVERTKTEQPPALSSSIWDTRGPATAEGAVSQTVVTLPPAPSAETLLGHGEPQAAPQAQATEAQTTEPAVQPETAEKKEEPLANFEAVVEQLSHGFVDRDLNDKDRRFLDVNGYKAGPILRGKHEFVMRAYQPTQEGKPPVVAFRGTVPSKVDTLIADVDPRGIGVYQFKPNRDLIQGVMQQAATRGPVVSTGHSLGGALAQLAAVTWPELVGQIITFQAPGIERELVARLKEYNAENPDKDIDSSHHRVAGDPIPLGGEALTPGTIHVHELGGINPLAKHLAFPLAQEELAQGNELPVHRPGQEITYKESFSTDEDRKLGLVEALRKGVGYGVFGAGTIIHGVGDAVQGVGSALGRLRRRLGG